MNQSHTRQARYTGFLFAILLIAVYAISTRANAQNSYKCGNTYSQVPCPGGVVVESADSRSNDQKKEADRVAAQSSKAADAMAKERIAQEARDRANNANAATVIGAKTEPAATSEMPKRPSVKKKKKKPDAEYFTAATPGKAKKAKKTKD